MSIEVARISFGEMIHDPNVSMIPWQAVPSFPSSFSVPFKGDQHLPCLHPGVRRDLEGLLKAVDFSEPHPGDGEVLRFPCAERTPESWPLLWNWGFRAPLIRIPTFGCHGFSVVYQLPSWSWSKQVVTTTGAISSRWSKHRSREKDFHGFLMSSFAYHSYTHIYSLMGEQFVRKCCNLSSLKGDQGYRAQAGSVAWQARHMA